MINVIIKVLTGVEFVVAILMIAVILLQQSKSTGGLGSMAGDVGENVLGAGASSFFRRFTIVLASLFMGLTLALAIITGRRPKGEEWSIGGGRQPKEGQEQIVPGESGKQPGESQSSSEEQSEGKRPGISASESGSNEPGAAGKSEDESGRGKRNGAD